ncbi:hypothetical protein DC31_01970 [Microbacterium sp. CH12i]|uniref:acyl carrier protein n=1 Tax=Microbacterium sp. CH12i TaxID=1479651 RepID=UPI000460EE79|nr:acyl carrier protein [Microbacterium sp. CH12i]KDA04888.1 hypothetical protein DC31_01970 [Microbacterium sp. CH12i]
MPSTIDAVRTVLIDTLELAQSPDDLTSDTALFGSLPELDSFGVVALVGALEDRFDITIDDDEFGAELFETVGTLVEFVDSKFVAEPEGSSRLVVLGVSPSGRGFMPRRPRVGLSDGRGLGARCA